MDSSLIQPDSAPPPERVVVTLSADSFSLNTYDVCALTDIGNERENNEDCVGYSYEGGNSLVLVVADGVGGYEGGEQASRMAVDVTLASYREQGKCIPWNRNLASQGNSLSFEQRIRRYG